VDGDGGRASVEACEIFFEARESLFVGVRANQAVGGAKCGGDEESLPTGSGAGVEDAFTGLGSEELDRVAGCGVLDVNGPGGEKVGGECAFEFIESGSVFHCSSGE
jgi:hypothetical protein